MKKRFVVLWLLPGCLLSCQSDDSLIYGIDPQLRTYSDEARVAKKQFCHSVNCENPYSEEVYVYNPAGQLIRVDQLSPTTSGPSEKFSYTDYLYSPDGQLSSQIRYIKSGSGSDWVANVKSDYLYANGLLSQERTFYHEPNPDRWVPAELIEYEFEAGQKRSQTWYDAQHSLNRRVVNDYKNNTLVCETWSNAKGDVIRRFEHRFAGNRRQINEYPPSTGDPISVVEKTYDDQGRLLSEETKVNNPLLCTMQAGVVRYTY